MVQLSVTLILLTALLGCAGHADPITDETYLLGTVIRVSIHDEGYKDSLIETVFERVAEIEARMSTSEDDYETTELLSVNRAAPDERTRVSPDTFEVLQSALEYSALSGGSFDVTIWPLVRLWKIGSGGTSVPPQEEIERARSLVDYTGLKLHSDGTVSLAREGMGVDVGAIAKGYAADEAARILSEAGVEHALLDFGGNILVIGAKPDNSPWRIGVQRPDAERSRYIGIVRTADRTVVTSGPYERFFEEDGVRYHHILNPKTGYPSRNGLEQVTIIAERSIDADALSTTCYVLGLEGALKLIEEFPDAEAVIVTETQEVYLTSGVERHTSAANRAATGGATDAEETEWADGAVVTTFELTDDEYRIVE